MDKKEGHKMFILTAPSGAGKTTVVTHLLKTFDHLDFSVSATTRDIRPKEEHGKDYYFLSVNEFKEKIENNAFAEWEEVYEGRFYGTLTSEIERIWEEGKQVVFDIDVAGAATIKKLYGKQCLAIFIRPPSLEILRERLLNRKTETPESLKRRVTKAEKELKWADRFDYILRNEDLDIALVEAELLVNTFMQR
jgi:guanylate kinase